MKPLVSFILGLLFFSLCLAAWTAHCCRKNEGVSAPWLSMKDLRDLDAALTAVRTGEAKSRGFYPRVFPVNEEMTLASGFAWNNR
jgi:hydroxyacylglutathione hydrolase